MSSSKSGSRSRSRTPLILAALFLAHAQIAAAQSPAEPVHGKGLIPTPPDVQKEIPLLPTFREWLPENVDLSGFMPLPGDQGAQGSCTAWAVGYAARAYYAVKKAAHSHRDYDLQSTIPSPAYIFNSIVQNKSCDGSRIDRALDLLKDAGSASIREYPYDQNHCDRPATSIVNESVGYRIDSYDRLNADDNDILDNIKGQLAQNNPVILSITTTPIFDHFKGDGIYDVQKSYVTQHDTGRHAITIVGYDERRQAFRLINSWGQRWGDRGYIWVSYDALPNMLNDAYVMHVAEHPAPVCSIEAQPAVITRGETATLSYTSKNADGGRFDHDLGYTGLSGSQPVTPRETTRYTATFSGRGGTVSCSAQITVREPAPPAAPTISSFVASEQSVQRGQAVQLSWSTTDATSLRIDPAVGPVTGDSVAVTPPQTTAYTLTASNNAGSVSSRLTVKVTEPAVPPPLITSFDATPEAITFGQSVKLQWSATGATSFRVDPDAGFFDGNSTTVSPKETTKYTLIASNRGSSVRAETTVTVNKPAPIVLPDVGCGKVALSERAGKPVVTGFVQDDADLEKLRLAAPVAGIDVRVRPWPLCEALTTMDRQLSLADEPKVSIHKTGDDSLIEGDHLVFEIETPSYPSYLHVAYLQADGSVVNLIQPGDSSFTTYQPHSRIVIGDGAGGSKRFRVSKPFGHEMLIVLAGKSPTFPEPLPKQQTEREFLTALRRALLYKPDPTAPDRVVAAAYDAIVTKAKGTP